MATTLALLAPDTRAAPEWGARLASLTLHMGLIALAVWSTRRPTTASAPPREYTTIFYLPERAPAAPPLRPAPAVPGGTWRMPALPSVIPTALPPLLPTPAPDWPASPPGLVPGPPGPIAEPLPSPLPAEGLVDVRVVEELPVLLSHPTPRYPDILRQAGIEGRVVVEAVIDTTGRAERDGLRIVSSSHALFSPEASALVLGSRYRPARFGGRPVRVRILVPVGFRLRR